MFSGSDSLISYKKDWVWTKPKVLRGRRDIFMLEVCGKYPRIIVVEINLQFDILKWQNGSWISAVEAPKKRRQKRRLVQAPFKAPIHNKCCTIGFRETGLVLVIVLRCDWPLCDIWFKSYEHFKIKMFLSVHTAGPWWIFQPKFYTFCVKSAPFKKAPGKKAAPFRRLCAFSHLGALRCQQL